MKPRRRWIVRHYSISLIQAAVDLDAEPTLLIERVFRWHWLARLDCSITNHAPTVGTHLFYATLEPMRPSLTTIDGGKAGVPKLQVGRTL